MIRFDTDLKRKLNHEFIEIISHLTSKRRDKIPACVLEVFFIDMTAESRIGIESKGQKMDGEPDADRAISVKPLTAEEIVRIARDLRRGPSHSIRGRYVNGSHTEIQTAASAEDTSEGQGADIDRKPKLTLSDEEFTTCLSAAQTVWRELNVEPLSFVSNSENVLRMNQEGKGEEIRRMAENYRAIGSSLPIKKQPLFCHLPNHLEPHVEAMAEVWKIRYKATPDKVDLASAEVRRRNREGLGHQLDILFSIIPSITRSAINKTTQKPIAATATA